jgi:hypothetical protein
MAAARQFSADVGLASARHRPRGRRGSTRGSNTMNGNCGRGERSNLRVREASRGGRGRGHPYTPSPSRATGMLKALPYQPDIQLTVRSQ